MTIDEAIERIEERASGNDRCAKDHAQFADWLRDLRRARMEIDLLKTLRDGFKADAQKYKAENAKQRGLITEMHSFITSLPSSVREHDDPLGNWEYTMRELGIEVMP